ncbi:transcriptional regulator LysR family [Vibrio maritimus]|uniref:Transcriptional regulator LysR family n=1 Tax=Vibrio maritimus TaxID=990268 RepID=A0A090S597_9VIBR|nr:transcriptional regulator LysR family [Vibrio maritimus]
MFSLEHMMLFKVAAESTSFSEAAKKSGKAVSTVSKAIAELEVDLDVKLFDRTTRIPKLTEAGERLLVKARLLFSQVDNIAQLSNEMSQSIESHLHVGIGPMITPSTYDTAVSKLSDIFPNTRISLYREMPEILKQNVIDGKLDLAIMTHAGRDSRLTNAGLCSIPLVLICSPDSRLTDFNIVSGDTLFTTRQIVCTSMLENTRMNLWVYAADIWDATSQEDVLRLVEQDLGWACIPQELASERIELGTLVEFNCNVAQGTMQLDVDLVRLENTSQGPVARTFIELLEQTNVQ